MQSNTPILFTTIDRADRQRQTYNDIESLAESIYTSGFIHPICINTDTNPPRLIAGGRRSAALDFILSNPDHFSDLIPHQSMVAFPLDHLLHFGIHYTHKATANEKEHSMLELVENIQRHDLSWQEEMLAIRKINRLKTQEAILAGDTWTQRRTGVLLGVSQASVSVAVTLANELDNPSSPLWKLPTAFDALQLLAKNKYDESSRALVERIKQRATTVPTIQPTSSPISGPSFISSFDPSKFISGGIAPIDMGAEFGTPTIPSPITVSEGDRDKIQSAYDVITKLVHNMKFEDFCDQVPAESYDHVLCDPPYGIKMANLVQGGQGQQNIDRIEETHDVEQNMQDFPRWLEGCYKIIKPKGFCVWFCDQAQWQYLYELATRIGFKVQRWPLVWCKTSPCINQRAEYNFTKATELAMVMRKGDARLVTAQASNYWLGGLTPEDKAAGVNHPFIKPKELWQWVLKAIALPGSTVVDGFSGVGSSTRAMMLAGYTPVGVECDPKHYDQQVQNLTKVYCELNGIEFK